jgi:hypothetical protein
VSHVYARRTLDAGFTTVRVLGAPELLRWQDRIGALEVGLFADVIGVEGDPLKDVTVLERKIPFVMKGGVVHAAPGARVTNP